MAVEVLSAILNGCPFGPHVPPVFRDDIDTPGKLGHFFIAIDPRRFPGSKTFLRQTEKMIDELHKAKPASGFESVLVPGEPESHTYAQRTRNGIPLAPDLWEKIQQLSSA